MLAGAYALVMVWWGGRNKIKDWKEKKDGKSVERGGGEPLKRIRVLWMVPVVYGVVAGVEALLAGSVVGLM